MNAARQAEAARLKRHGVWIEVLENDVPAKATILAAILANEIKEPNTRAANYEARYVAKGCDDKEEPLIVRNLLTLLHSLMKAIVSTSAVLGWRLSSHNVNQVLLQNKDAMERGLYVRVREAFANFF